MYNESGVVFSDLVHHEAGKKTLPINFAYTLQEKEWRNKIVQEYGCCKYLSEQEFENKAFLKCNCDGEGLYC